MAKIQAYTDKLPIGLSLICTIHCLFFPMMMILVPSFAALSLANEDLFHQLMIYGVLPSSSIALMIGFREHRHCSILFFGILGVTLLILSSIWGHRFLGEDLEKWAMLASSFFIIFAHFNNSRLCQKKEPIGLSFFKRL